MIALRAHFVTSGSMSQVMNPHTPDGAPADAEFVIYRLNEAGTTLLSLPDTGYSTRLRTARYEVLQPCIEVSGWDAKRLRPPTPTSAQITRMDQAMGWITRIPVDRKVLRRLVGARSLVSPLTGRHLFSWRRLGKAIGADHKAVQRWHDQGIDLICHSLNS